MDATTRQPGDAPAFLAVWGITLDDVDAAISTIRHSRGTHVEWRDHIRACAHCQQHPPKHVHGPDEQEAIIARYDSVLTVLTAVRGA